MGNEISVIPQTSLVANGQDVITFVCDSAKEVGMVIPSSWKKIIGAHARTLLADEMPADVVLAAAWMSVLRGQPQVLQYIAGDLMLARSGLRMGRKEYAHKLALFAAEGSQANEMLAEQKERLARRRGNGDS